jgi:hypothetical protein
MVHLRKQKGDIAAAFVIADLTLKGYTVFTPTVSEHLPFDMIAYKEEKAFRVQAKYSSSGNVSNKNCWNDKHGTHTKEYNENDFDYYAIYLSDINKVVYPSIKFGGIRISTSIPNSPTPFWWWKDFQLFTDVAEKRHYKDFGVELTQGTSHRKLIRQRTESCILSSFQRRKVTRPIKEELEKLLWEMPTLQLAKRFGVSDKAIEKWAKSYDIIKPPRGYWSKLKSSDLDETIKEQPKE